MAEIIVTSTADSGAGSLRQAIADAADGDVILFDSDVFPAGQTTSILLSSYIVTSKRISLYGGFPDGQGGYTSGATITRYVVREVDGVETEVVVDDDHPAAEGDVVLMHVTTRVALDGQAVQDPDAADEWSGWTGTRLFSFPSPTVATIVGIAFINGLSTASESPPFLHTEGTDEDHGDYTVTDCSFKNGINTTGYCGGVRIRRALARFEFCEFDNCKAKKYGGAIYAPYTTTATLVSCVATNCSASSGGGVFLSGTSQNILNNCIFDSCTATSGGGAIYSSGDCQNILNGCAFDSCSTTGNAGALVSDNQSKNTLADCVFDSCNAASNGGGVYSYGTSQNTLTNCTIRGCTARSYGGGVYAGNSSTVTLNDCEITQNTANNGGGLCAYNSATANINNCIIKDNITTTTDQTQKDVSIISNSFGNITASEFGALRISNTATVTIVSGVTTAQTARTLRQNATSPTITINDGAALSFTDSATISEESVFTSSGRGYLAVGAGINTSLATFENVVLCAYGADVSSFAEVDGVLEWSADDPSVSVLIEREDNDAWTTLAQTTGESLDYYLPPKVNLRLFDGERFLTTATPDSRTYFYIGGAEGSFDDAEDWSLTKNGTAIPQSPTITDCAFVIQGAEGDVAISKGSANVTNATIIPAGTNDIAVTVDEATVLAGTERFTGTLTTTGDVAITGDASKLAIVVDGTLEVAGSLKLATLTLTSGSSVVFASAGDVLVVTGSATVNDATFSCEEPTAYFTAPVGTDLTQATFTNVYVATKGAEVVSVTGSRFGKNYSINIISEDNTLPVTVEYRLEGTTEWIVADPAFVGTTFQIRLDDDATFRVYNGEKFTEATMKVYGLYNEMAAIVEIGYLI